MFARRRRPWRPATFPFRVSGIPGVPGVPDANGPFLTKKALRCGL